MRGILAGGGTLPRRLAGYAWMSKWLKGQEDDGVEPQFPLATETELECTKTGQVATSRRPMWRLATEVDTAPPVN